MERGIRIGQGRHVFQKALCTMVRDLAGEFDTVNDQIAKFDAEIKTIAQQDADMSRLTEIPGIGPMIASALGAAIGDVRTFNKARDLSAWLGGGQCRSRRAVKQSSSPYPNVATPT